VSDHDTKPFTGGREVSCPGFSHIGGHDPHVPCTSHPVGNLPGADSGVVDSRPV
jgi:hypothetical protein